MLSWAKKHVRHKQEDQAEASPERKKSKSPEKMLGSEKKTTPSFARRFASIRKLTSERKRGKSSSPEKVKETSPSHPPRPNQGTEPLLQQEACLSEPSSSESSPQHLANADKLENREVSEEREPGEQSEDASRAQSTREDAHSADADDAEVGGASDARATQKSCVTKIHHSSGSELIGDQGSEALREPGSTNLHDLVIIDSEECKNPNSREKDDVHLQETSSLNTNSIGGACKEGELTSHGNIDDDNSVEINGVYEKARRSDDELKIADGHELHQTTTDHKESVANVSVTPAACNENGLLSDITYIDSECSDEDCGSNVLEDQSNLDQKPLVEGDDTQKDKNDPPNEVIKDAKDLPLESPSPNDKNDLPLGEIVKDAKDLSLENPSPNDMNDSQNEMVKDVKNLSIESPSPNDKNDLPLGEIVKDTKDLSTASPSPNDFKESPSSTTDVPKNGEEPDVVMESGVQADEAIQETASLGDTPKNTEELGGPIEDKEESAVAGIAEEMKDTECKNAPSPKLRGRELAPVSGTVEDDETPPPLPLTGPPDDSEAEEDEEAPPLPQKEGHITKPPRPPKSDLVKSSLGRSAVERPLPISPFSAFEGKASSKADVLDASGAQYEEERIESAEPQCTNINSKETDTLSPSHSTDTNTNSKETDTLSPSHSDDTNINSKETDTLSPSHSDDTNINSKETDTLNPSHSDDTNINSKETDTLSPSHSNDTNINSKETDTLSPSHSNDTNINSKETDTLSPSHSNDTNTNSKETVGSDTLSPSHSNDTNTNSKETVGSDTLSPSHCNDSLQISLPSSLDDSCEMDASKDPTPSLPSHGSAINVTETIISQPSLSTSYDGSHAEHKTLGSVSDCSSPAAVGGSLPSSPSVPRRTNRPHPVPAARSLQTLSTATPTKGTVTTAEKEEEIVQQVPKESPEPQRESSEPSRDPENIPRDIPVPKPRKISLNPFESDEGEESEIQQKIPQKPVPVPKPRTNVSLNPFESDDDESTPGKNPFDEDTQANSFSPVHNTTVESEFRPMRSSSPTTHSLSSHLNDSLASINSYSSKVANESTSTNPFDEDDDDDEGRDEHNGMIREATTRKSFSVMSSSPLQRDVMRSSLPPGRGRTGRKKRPAPLPPGYRPQAMSTLSRDQRLFPDNGSSSREGSASSITQETHRRDSVTSVSSMTASPKKPPPPRPPPPKVKINFMGK